MVVTQDAVVSAQDVQREGGGGRGVLPYYMCALSGSIHVRRKFTIRKRKTAAGRASDSATDHGCTASCDVPAVNAVMADVGTRAHTPRPHPQLLHWCVPVSWNKRYNGQIILYRLPPTGHSNGTFFFPSIFIAKRVYSFFIEMLYDRCDCYSA